MPKTVQVDGIGNVEFADEFSDDEIKHQVGQLYLKQDAARPASHTSTFKQFFPALFGLSDEQKQNADVVKQAHVEARANGQTPRDMAANAQLISD